MSEQKENIERVSSKITWLIIKFCIPRVGQQFHVEELRKFVYAGVDGYVAPASPDRILRQLRQAGTLDYKVVSRHESLYQVLSVKQQQGKLF